MERQPIDRPQRGQPMLASWGAAVADGINAVSAGLDALRGPGRITSFREPTGAAKDGLYPFLVRFVPDPEGDGTEGDLIIYIPPGALSVNGTAAGQDDYPLEPYAAGDYAGSDHWYELSGTVSDCTFWLDFKYGVPDGAFDSIGFGDAPDEGHDDDQSAVRRSVAIASVSVTPADGEARGRVAVAQIAKGPLAYEIGVRSVNGMAGAVRVAADENGGVSIEGTTVFASVRTEPKDGAVLIGLSTAQPDDGGGGAKGYCNAISGEGRGDDRADDPGGNAISDDAAGEVKNDISQDTCKTEAGNGNNQ